MQYQIIEADSKDKLEKDVQLRLLQGWQLQGGVCVVYSPVSGNWWYYQALVWLDD